MAQSMPDRYRSAGFGAPVRRGRRPAVLVVDLSRGFTDPDVPIGSNLDAQVEATAELLRTADEHGAPVVFSTIAFPEGVPYAWLDKSPGLAVLREGSTAVQIDPRLPRRDRDPVVVKRAASAFFGTDLVTLLRAEGADTVLICGATTSGCVRATAVDSVQYGFGTLVVADCVGDRADAPHDASLFDIQAKYGDVLRLDAALDYLRGTAPAPSEADDRS